MKPKERIPLHDHFDNNSGGPIVAQGPPQPAPPPSGGGSAGEPTADAHIADTGDAHDASAISIADSGAYFTGTDVEAALQELGAGGGGGSVATDTIWDAKGDLAGGTGANTAARLAVGTNGHVLTADSAETTGMKWAAATGTTDDPIADVFGAADTAYEFTTTSLTGLTALGTVGAEDADTTVPDHYYLMNNTNASPYYRGIGVTGLSAPFTAITKVISNGNANYEQAGLILGPSTWPSSGASRMFAWGIGTTSNRVAVELWSAPGTYSSTTGASAAFVPAAHLYFGIRVASATDVSFYWSPNGRLWFSTALAHNPGFTPTIVGMVSGAQNTTGLLAAFDFLRIWNSAETFLA